MNRLSGQQVAALSDALVQSFSYAELSQLVRINLEENLEAIAGSGKLAEDIFALVEWAQRHDRLHDLLTAAQEKRPTDTTFATLAVALGAEPIPPTPKGDLHSTSMPGGTSIGNIADSNVSIGGNQTNTNITTGGGAYIGAPLHVEGDFIGRDKVTYVVAQPGSNVLVDKGQRVNVESEPSVRLESPQSIEEFVGRETEIESFLETLQESRLAVICGRPGLGKTMFASVLANRSAKSSSNIFWYSCARYHADTMSTARGSARNTAATTMGVDSFLAELAAFLYWNGQREFWHYLQGQRLADTPAAGPSEQIGVLLKWLQKSDGHVLCLDDYQVVQSDPSFAYLMERLLALLPESNLTLIVTSKDSTPFSGKTSVQDLCGFGSEDVQKLAGKRGLELPLPICEQLEAKTGGNLTLLTFAIDLIKQSEDPSSLIANLMEHSEDIYDFIFRESFESLTEDERSVMFAMAVLLGRFSTPGAIAAVADDKTARITITTLRKRFLLMMRGGTNGVEYAQHSLVQEFYYGLLREDRLREMHARAAKYFSSADALQAAEHFLRAGETEAAAAAIPGNVWQIVNRGEAHGLRQLLTRLSPDRLTPLLWASICLADGQVNALLGDNTLARQRFEDVLSVTEAIDAADERRQLRVDAYDGLGRLLEQESPKEALTLLERATEEMQGGGDREEAILNGRLGSIYTALGQYEDALRTLEHARAQLDTTGDRRSPLRASVMTNLGNIYSARYSIDEGNEAYAQALAITESFHDDMRSIAILSNLGINYEISGDWQKAEEHYKKVLKQTERLDSLVDRIRTMNSLGTLYTKQGNDEQAAEMLDSAIVMARSHSNDEDLAYALTSRADLYIRQERFAAAEAPLVEAERLADDLGLDHLQAEIDALWALFMINRNNQERATEHAEAALQYAQAEDLIYEKGRFLRTRGLVYAADKLSDAANEAFQQSSEHLQKLDPFEFACTQLAWGQLLLARQSLYETRAKWMEAEAMLRTLAAKRELSVVQRRLSKLGY